jgi:regulation of enolase protein 1 (concanavalin A-like superfamily)
VAGTFSENGETLSIGGSGADIWDKADAFNYVYRSASGDGVLTVHVVDLQNTDPWAKAGLMFRESLDPDSAFAEVLVTPKNGVGFQQRTNAGAVASSVKLLPKLHAPCWLRLTRQGDTFTAESSSDGNKWAAAGSSIIAMKERVFAGLVVCSHKNTELCQATFDHAALTSSSTPGGEAKSGANAAPVAVSPAVPKVTAPPANDTNWLLTLGTNEMPDAPVAGRIHGQDFLMEHASFGSGSLTLRAGTKGPVELGAVISFGGATAEELTGKTINVTTNAEKAAKVTLRWKDDSGTVQKPAFDSGYALRLQFGLLANNRLPGKIYLCLPDDEKSYLTGSFVANVSKPKPKPEPKPQKQ